MDEYSGTGTTPRDGNSRSERMVEPDDVGVMLGLHRRG